MLLGIPDPALEVACSWQLAKRSGLRETAGSVDNVNAVVHGLSSSPKQYCNLIEDDLERERRWCAAVLARNETERGSICVT